MNKYINACFLVATLNFAIETHAGTLPENIAQQLPKGYTELVAKSADLNNDKRNDYIVVAHKETEKNSSVPGERAPRRPLLVFIQNADGTFTLAARNDRIVYAADEGGQCDPFPGDDDGLAVNGAFFTVQNSVACGQHWTDYLTFRYSPEIRNFVFHKRIFESWRMNTSKQPNAEALVLGKRTVSSGDKNRPILLRDYRPDQ